MMISVQQGPHPGPTELFSRSAWMPMPLAKKEDQAPPERQGLLAARPARTLPLKSRFPT